MIHSRCVLNQLPTTAPWLAEHEDRLLALLLTFHVKMDLVSGQVVFVSVCIQTTVDRSTGIYRWGVLPEMSQMSAASPVSWCLYAGHHGCLVGITSLHCSLLFHSLIYSRLYAAVCRHFGECVVLFSGLWQMFLSQVGCVVCVVWPLMFSIDGCPTPAACLLPWQQHGLMCSKRSQHRISLCWKLLSFSSCDKMILPKSVYSSC